MTPHAFVPSVLGAPLLGILGVLFFVPHAHAQERAEVEQLQATTHALIETLVESGVLTRESATKLLAVAKAKVQAQAQAPVAELGKDGKKVVRVPYVPESVKNEMRNQIKEEVLVQARSERWGEPGTFPEWTKRFKFEGDFRLREERTRLSPDNTSALDYQTTALTRAADIVQSASGNKQANFNTQDDSNRMRLRARLGATATLSDEVSATVRLSTGNTSDRTSTNQTLGQYFNKYSVVVDQAYVALQPFGQQLTLSGGRLPNPFFSTDLVWADDLGFEGVAVTAKKDVFANGSGFLTAGYFPLSENRPGTSRSRSLIGVQTGLDMKLGASSNRLKFGLAVYDYKGIEGQQEDLASSFLEREYATRYEYPSGFRQRGNTLFNVRAPGDAAAATYGLSSGFRELNLTAALDLVNLLPQPLRITGDYVKNLKFNRSEIEQRTGVALTDGKDYGFLAKVQVGPTQTLKRGDWNASLAYRYLGSDAALDAFTNSDFGLGGTNSKGFILGMNYGIFNNTWLSARWMSSNPIHSYSPGTPTKLSVDTVQLELNARF
jgi:hypothetical protein